MGPSLFRAAYHNYKQLINTDLVISSTFIAIFRGMPDLQMAKAS